MHMRTEDWLRGQRCARLNATTTTFSSVLIIVVRGSFGPVRRFSAAARLCYFATRLRIDDQLSAQHRERSVQSL